MGETMAQYAAVLDTCVLYGTLTRDLLLGSAEAGLFRPVWSAEILEELARSLVQGAGCTEEQLSHLTQCMNEAFPDAALSAPSELVASISRQLKDPDDAHVIATAVVAKADAINTRNLEHFPDRVLEQYRLQAIGPDDFLVNQWDLEAKVMLKVALGCHGKLKKNSPNWAEWIGRLRKQGVGLHLFAARLEAARQSPEPADEE